MDKRMIEKWMNGLSKGIIVVGIIAVLVSILAFGNTVNMYYLGEKGTKLYKGINKNIGTLAEIIGLATGSLWLFRKGWVELKKRKWPFAGWIQQFFLLIRKHHIYLGILTLVVSFAHGTYFFFYADQDHQWTKFSGIVAFIALVILALLGWRHNANRKTKKNLPTKKHHILLAIIFGILFLVHINI